MDEDETQALLDTIAAWRWYHDTSWLDHGSVFDGACLCLLDDKELGVVREAMR